MTKVRSLCWLSTLPIESQEALCQSSKWHKNPQRTSEARYNTVMRQGGGLSSFLTFLKNSKSQKTDFFNNLKN